MVVVVSGIVVGGILGFVFRKPILDAGTGTLMGFQCAGEQSRDMSSADPRLRSRVEPIMKTLRSEGYKFQISSVYRSRERQECLYDISRVIERHTGQSGFTKTKNSLHSRVRKDEPASLAIDLHIYGESEEKTVQFYKRLRELAVEAGLRSGGNYKKRNPYWKKFGLGWDPGHVYLGR
jgi:hypothetical protein